MGNFGIFEILMPYAFILMNIVMSAIARIFVPNFYKSLLGTFLIFLPYVFLLWLFQDALGETLYLLMLLIPVASLTGLILIHILNFKKAKK